MSEDGRFWIACWALVAAVLITLFACFTVNSIHRKEVFLKAVQAGADPLEVSCALDVDENYNKPCLIAGRK